MLLLEDNADDVLFFTRSLAKLHNPPALLAAVSEDEALKMVDEPTIRLIVIDGSLLALGNTLLGRIRSLKHLRLTPVVAWSSDFHPTTLERLYASGVNSCLIKPSTLSEFEKAVKTLVDYWCVLCELPPGLRAS